MSTVFLAAEDLKTYSAQQVTSLADIDPFAVETEGERRQTEAEKIERQIAKLAAKAAKLRKEGEQIIRAAWAAK